MTNSDIDVLKGLAFSKNEDVVFEKYDGLYVFDADTTDTTHILNETGMHIFNRMTSPFSFENALDAVLSEYDVEELEATDDVCLIINDMLRIGLIKTVPARRTT